MQNLEKRRKPGRPTLGPRKRTRASFTLEPRHALWLQEAGRAQGKSASQILDEIIERASREPASRLRISVPTQAVRAFCEKHGVAKLALYGSVLTERFGPDSDVDAWVDFLPGREISYFDLAAMEEELSRLFASRKVDLKTRAELSRYFRDEVTRDAEIVYAA